MASVSIQEAQAGLAALIHGLAPGSEIVITENDRPIARLVSEPPQGGRKLGTLQGTVLHMAADFDAPI
jgi:antitoxin (DNA-binding transcriptional repressor) of toxin-antitoxin stability system